VLKPDDTVPEREAASWVLNSPPRVTERALMAMTSLKGRRGQQPRRGGGGDEDVLGGDGEELAGEEDEEKREGRDQGDEVGECGVDRDEEADEELDGCEVR
jgi:hypothetical protein